MEKRINVSEFSLAPSRRGGAQQKGFTLVEILVVLGIAAGIMGFAATYIGSTPISQMRRESANIIRIVSYAYYQAAAQGRYYRVSFNLDDQNYLVEQSDSPFYVIKEGDEKEALRRKNEEDSTGIDSLMEGEESSAPATPPASGSFAESEDELLSVNAVPNGIRLRDVYVMHQKEPASGGKSYLYFFPRGQTEFAVIHFCKAEVIDEEVPDDEDDSGNYMTLIVNPLNGSVEVRDRYVDYETVLEEMGAT